MIPYCILAIEDDSDREFMTALYYQYRKLMYSTTQKILKDQWSTDDVVQTSLEKLIDKIPLLRTLDQNHLANYIISTCKNNAYNLCRHRSNSQYQLLMEGIQRCPFCFAERKWSHCPSLYWRASNRPHQPHAFP